MGALRGREFEGRVFVHADCGAGNGEYWRRYGNCAAGGAARELAGSMVRVELLAAAGPPAAVAASVLRACALAAVSVGAVA